MGHFQTLSFGANDWLGMVVLCSLVSGNSEKLVSSWGEFLAFFIADSWVKRCWADLLQKLTSAMPKVRRRACLQLSWTRIRRFFLYLVFIYPATYLFVLLKQWPYLWYWGNILPIFPKVTTLEHYRVIPSILIGLLIGTLDGF